VQFELVGSLLGLALYNSVILDVHFPLVVYRKLKHESVSLNDLQDFRPEVAQNLKVLLEYQNDDLESVFSLDFTITRESWGQVVEEELIPNGKSIPVTQKNKRAYVQAYLKWLLVDSVANQFNAFARGFHNVAGGPALDLFRAEELQLAVTGSSDLDFEALQKATLYEEPYSATHTTVQQFWSVVHSLSPEDKRKFLAFSTGSDRAPIKGLGSLKFVVSRAGPDSERLLTAHTCFNHVLLPEYSSRDKLETKLRAAIQESEGFGLI
jgi:ubiquitin-protein ligase E3 A